MRAARLIKKTGEIPVRKEKKLNNISLVVCYLVRFQMS